MTSCLGIYIEPNIIKYAKVSKERDILKIDSFGIKFYDKIGEAIEQIINDTISFKIPISINLSDEMYQYFYMFNLLNKNDLKKAIQTEFEAYCLEKGINKNALESRFVWLNSIEDKEKVKVIHVSTNKNTLNNLEQHFLEYRVSSITPIATSISNIANLKQKENILIVNMEKETTFTTIIDQKIYQVDKIEEGANQVLESISTKENSYSKAYEICKNTTIYTMAGQELQDEENEYLENIMPTLYKIANKVQEKLSNETIKIEKIYLTGTLSAVNNVDLYFQEVLQMEKCEILKPFFIKDSVKVNIKDYIEVNSAIALALQGLGIGLKDLNFKRQTLRDDVNGIFGQIGGEKKQKDGKSTANFTTSLRGKFDSTERWLMRMLGALVILTVLYSGFAIFINNSIVEKNKELANVKQDTLKQIEAVNNDINKVKSKKNEYEQLSDNLKNISEQAAENSKSKKIIPILLCQIMVSMPQGVQITSIENTTGRHIVIHAQSTKYEQLGYFKAILKTQGILTPDTIVSSSGEKQNDVVKVIIEGDMP